MSPRNSWFILPALLLALATVPPAAHADEYNQFSYLTFNQPVRISSPRGTVVLPAGAYAFKLMDTAPDRNVVEVFDSDFNFATFAPAVSTEYRATSPSELIDHTILTFAEGSKDQPVTLVQWFYPGQRFGHRFVYSRRMEKRLSEDRMITVASEPGGEDGNGAVSAVANIHVDANGR